jgi:hypothetical protein
MAYPKRAVTDEMRKVIVENSNANAAKILRVSKSTISSICRDEGIRPKTTFNADGTPRGWRRAEICRMWKEGASIADICEEYDLRVSTVCAVLAIPTLTGIALFMSETDIKRLDKVKPAGVGRDEYVVEIISAFVADSAASGRK